MENPRLTEKASPELAQQQGRSKTRKNKTLQVITLQGFIVVCSLGLEPRTHGLKVSLPYL